MPNADDAPYLDVFSSVVQAFQKTASRLDALAGGAFLALPRFP